MLRVMTFAKLFKKVGYDEQYIRFSWDEILEIYDTWHTCIALSRMESSFMIRFNDAAWSNRSWWAHPAVVMLVEQSFLEACHQHILTCWCGLAALGVLQSSRKVINELLNAIPFYLSSSLEMSVGIPGTSLGPRYNPFDNDICFKKKPLGGDCHGAHDRRGKVGLLQVAFLPRKARSCNILIALLLLLAVRPGAPSSFLSLLLVIRPGAPRSDALCSW